jgi:hypothetical protein
MAMSRAERVQRRRPKLHAAGLRSLRIWVLDTRAQGFAEECRRQSQLVRAAETSASRAEDDAWEAASWEAITGLPAPLRDDPHDAG